MLPFILILQTEDLKRKVAQLTKSSVTTASFESEQRHIAYRNNEIVVDMDN